MARRLSFRTFLMISVCFTFAIGGAAAGQTASFSAGYAQRDITPRQPMPMWGYGDRHAELSTGIRDPLLAKAVVVQAGDRKVALVGLDLGRAPLPESVTRIRRQVEAGSGVGHVMLVGSHTHHGPVLELQDEPGKGGEKFPYATQYPHWLEEQLIDCINEAASAVQPATVGWGRATIDMNRNRHTKIEPKPRDDDLTVLRFDDASGEPIATLVNFAAHPTNLPVMDLRWSAEYPGEMMRAVEAATGGPCVFLQGAAGDMSCKTSPETDTIEAFGAALAAEVLEIRKSIATAAPEAPAIEGRMDSFTYETRLDFSNSFIQNMFRQAFFPEIADSFFDFLEGNRFDAYLTTVLLNDEIALVGGSGEFFCQHANRLKERSRAPLTVFLGYCNGHNMYFPTVEAAAEGGYGADATVSWVSLGAGEEMMNQALINIYTMLGAYKMPALN